MSSRDYEDRASSSRSRVSRTAGDPQGSKSSSDYASSSRTSRRRSSVEHRSRGDQENDQVASGDELVIGFEHRMSTDERRRMREREAGEAAAAGRRSSTVGGSTDATTLYGRSSRRASLTEQYRIPGADAISERASSSVHKRTAYSRSIEKQDRSSRQAEVDRILKSSRERRSSATEEDQKSRSTSGSNDDVNGYGRRTSDTRRSSAVDSEAITALAREKVSNSEHRTSDPLGPKEKSSRSERSHHSEDKSDRILKKKERSSRDESSPEKKSSSRRSSRTEEERERRRSSRSHKEEDGAAEPSERRRSSHKHRDDEETSERRRSSRSEREDGRSSPSKEERSERHRSDSDRHRRHRSSDEAIPKDSERKSSHRRAKTDDGDEKSSRRKEKESRSRSRDSSDDSGRRRSASERSRLLRQERVQQREGPRYSSVAGESEVPTHPSRLSSMQREPSTSSRNSHGGSGRALTSREVDAPSFIRNSVHNLQDGSGGAARDRLSARKLGESEPPSRSDKRISEKKVDREFKLTRTSKEVPPESETDDDELDYSVDSSTDEESWTVRVSLISASDLPLSMLPNMPLCPVVKFGLVRLPGGESGSGDEQTKGIKGRRSVQARIEKSGLISIPKARVRCSSGKILSKRDNGTVEYYEELRWDNVKRPRGTALAVELCARAVLPPLNSDESPFIKEESSSVRLAAPSTVSSLTSSDMRRVYSLDNTEGHARPAPSRGGNRNASWSQPHDETNVDGAARNLGLLGLNDLSQGGLSSKSLESTGTAESNGDDSQSSAGIAGMRALWRKGRQQFEQRQAAKRKSDADQEVADALAGLLGRENDSGPGALDSARSLHDRNSFNSLKGEKASLQPTARNSGSSADENVALVPPRKKRKLEMAKDVHIGSIVIPLTRLPLDKVILGKEAVRIEQWYQFDGDTGSLTQAPPTPSWRGQSTPKTTTRRNPSILLEISFSTPELLDESEDEMDEASDGEHGALRRGSTSFARRASNEGRAKVDQIIAATPTPVEPKKLPDDPLLEPGVIDFVAVVGAKNIGDQKDDDGTVGWVNTIPECAVLEQFPPNDEFHLRNGRNASLMDKVEWFCFPDGWKLWRGSEPPTHSDLNLKRFSASSPAHVASSIPAFDACLNCTTSFSWFVISSNADSYGSRTMKTYGAVIRFYVPAPPGIDLTQDDYAQPLVGLDKADSKAKSRSSGKRLWVPMGICVTSNIPIVGVMEAVLLRICESLVARAGGGLHSAPYSKIQSLIQRDLANLIVNYQRPIPGVLHCSIPFLSGERLHLTLPPPTGLPPLPHGSAITAACRLLGSEGLNLLLAAVLTECKILVHSHEVANLAMIAEVVTALIYPFSWALPYIPVLPDAMLEFIEAPLSYLLGVPTSSMKLIDPNVLSDVVVVDLDNGFSSPDYFEGRRGGRTTKVPTPLPSPVASDISKAVFRLLREEEEVEEEYGASNFPGSRSMPRLESESLAEREFRIAVAIQICSLVRGYDDCLFKVSASQPVFNRDKFLRTAPALFDNQRGNIGLSGSTHVQPITGSTPQRTLSPRSKRFLSLLVNCQHFHQFLESLDDDECVFFNEVMYTFDMNDKKEEPVANSLIGNFGTSKLEEATEHLTKTLQKVEDKIPTYRVERKAKNGQDSDGTFDDDDTDATFDSLAHSQERRRDVGFAEDGSLTQSFTAHLLQQVVDPSAAIKQASGSRSDDDGSTASNQSEVRSLSVQYLMELEKNNWRYTALLQMSGENQNGKEEEEGDQFSFVTVWEKVKLKEAIGERRYRAWKLARDQKHAAEDSSTRGFTGDVIANEGQISLDLASLLTSATDDMTSEASSVTTSITSLSSHASKRRSSLTADQQRVADAKDREVLRRCLERAYDETQYRQPRSGRRTSPEEQPQAYEAFVENGRDLIAEAETALRNPSAQKFLVNVLSQRSRLETQRKRRSSNDDGKGRKAANQSSVSRLEPAAFECVVRLCCAMLDACLEYEDYEPAYDLLKQTAGFCTILSKDGAPMSSKELELSHDQGNQVVYMTGRIGLHPIFADLSLWEKVQTIHLKDSDKSGRSTPVEPNPSDDSSPDVPEYEAAVATLYDMLGFGIPAEELARFATRVSEQRGWFSSERGHSLLMLARRLTVRREHGDEGAVATGDLEILNQSKSPLKAPLSPRMKSPSEGDAFSGGKRDDQVQWETIGWCHPAAQVAGRLPLRDSASRGGEPDRLKRSPVTSLASFGPSIIASGGLDGGVFVAHTIHFESEDDHDATDPAVHGVRLDWGSSASRTTAISASSSSMDGEYGVGAVSCLAAAKGAGYRHSVLAGNGGSPNGDVGGLSTEDDMLSAMEGCRVAAGTTAGDLRVWSVKDVYAATVLAKKSDEASVNDAAASLGQMRLRHGSGEGASSSYVTRSRRGSITEIAAGNAFSRLKFSLRGRALSGHRGGVACIDVPSHVYRPDSLVTGGADGFIKLWSLRQPTAGRRASGDTLGNGTNTKLFSTSSIVGSTSADRGQTRGKAGRGGDALSILSGHTGKVLCVQTAWHGDRLLSGGSDRTLRVWDLAGSGGKCTHALTGHLGWVTHAEYWGPNTIVSASTDRSVALWDARVRQSPLFVLRHHHSPVSDILVGTRTDPLMVSASADGTIATWDFRALSGAHTGVVSSEASTVHHEKKCTSVRNPAAIMSHCAEGKGVKQSGPILLSRGILGGGQTVLSVGVDGVVHEWDIASGQLLSSEATGHCDVVSSFSTFSDTQNSLSAGVEPSSEVDPNHGGMITSSWDGTVRIRRFIRNK